MGSQTHRVLVLTSSFPRWHGDYAGSFVLNLAMDLIACGWNVDVLTPHTPNSAKYEIIDGVSVYRFLYCWPESFETICSQGSALANLKNNPLEILKVFPLVTLQLINAFVLHAKNRYDLIHSHWLLPQGLNGALFSKITGIPHVVTVHGGDIFGLNVGILSRLKGFAVDCADAVTVNSSVTGKAVTELEPKPKTNNLYTIPMGVADLRNVGREEINDFNSKYRCDEGPVLLFVGRLVEEKGVGDFLEAISLLVENTPNITAVIVGSGQDREKYEEKSHELGLSEKVSFVGAVNPEDVSVYYKSADIFVGPSKKAYHGGVEGQGLAFIEAMLAEIPVVATASGGIVDSVIHEETGLLVDEGSPEGIATAVLRLFSDQKLSEKLKKRGKQLAMENFSRTKSAENFSQLFQKLVGKNQKKSRKCNSV